MKKILAFLSFILITSCQITETIHLNSDGSGDIVSEQFREENSYMQLAGESYGSENIFQDTTYVFNAYIEKYKETFLKYTPEEQKLFQTYANVKVHLKKSSFEKEFRNTFSLHFNKVSEIPDLYKTEDYADDLENNYALTAETHYYKISYDFEGKIFKRSVSIINAEELQKAKDGYKNYESKYGNLKLTQFYTLQYHFPQKIKSVSNEKAVVSSDKKSLTLEFKLSDCLRDPEMTNLEVILE